jgi:hypothetical protein
MCMVCRVRYSYYQYRFVCFACRRYWKSPGLSLHCDGSLADQMRNKSCGKEELEAYRRQWLKTFCTVCGAEASEVNMRFEPPCQRDVRSWQQMEATWKKPMKNERQHQEEPVFEGWKELIRQKKMNGSAEKKRKEKKKRQQEISVQIDVELRENTESVQCFRSELQSHVEWE